MKQILEELLLEMEGDQESDTKLAALTRSRFEEARKIKQLRSGRLKMIKAFTDRLTETVNLVSGKLIAGNKHISFLSPIAATIIEKKCSSDWMPSLTFEPEERFGKGADIYLARNGNRVFDFGMKVGKFKKACQDGALDLYEKGRMILQMGYTTKKNMTDEDEEYLKATFIRIKNKKWESVYWTEDEHSWFIIEEFSYGEAIEEFGEEIKNYKVQEGDLYEKDQTALDATEQEDLRKTIQVAHFYCDTQKIYTCQIGGADNFYKKLTNGSYPFVDEWDEGFVPISYIDASAIKRDGHPICDMDKIMPICLNYDKLFQGVIRKAQKSSRSRDIIGSLDPKRQRLEYLQDMANETAGLDTPHFMKIQEGSQLFAKTLDTPYDLNSPMALRDAFLEEITMTTGVNLRLQGQGAETARQEELRMRRELEVIDENIKINEPNWERFCLNYMQMLKNVDSDFYDEYVAIEDETSDELGVPMDGTVGDVMKALDGFSFNVKVSVNQSNSKRKALEIAQKEAAFNAIAPHAQGSPGVMKMAFELVEDKFSGTKFLVDDFMPQAPPVAPEAMPQAEGLQQLTAQ